MTSTCARDIRGMQHTATESPSCVLPLPGEYPSDGKTDYVRRAGTQTNMAQVGSGGHILQAVHGKRVVVFDCWDNARDKFQEEEQILLWAHLAATRFQL